MTVEQRILARRYPFTATLNEDGSWYIIFPDLPGIMTSAATWDEIGPTAQEALRLWLQTELEDGHPIPLPTIGRPEDEEPWRNDSHLSPEELADVPRLTSQEVANELGLSRRRVLALAKSRELGRKVGRDVLFSEADLDAMRDRQPGRPHKTRHHLVPAS